MSDAYSHWGPITVGAEPDTRASLRSLVDAELSDTRVFVNFLFRDFTRGGHRAFTAKLIESGGEVPWYMLMVDRGPLARR